MKMAEVFLKKKKKTDRTAITLDMNEAEKLTISQPCSGGIVKLG